MKRLIKTIKSNMQSNNCLFALPELGHDAYPANILFEEKLK